MVLLGKPCILESDWSLDITVW